MITFLLFGMQRAGAGETSPESAGPADKAELDAYAESLSRYITRANHLIQESDSWIKGFSEFGSAANVASFSETVRDLIGKIKPLMESAETAGSAAADGNLDALRNLQSAQGDELGRLVLLLDGMKSNYIIERKRKLEADNAVEEVISYFNETVTKVIAAKKILDENIELAATPELKKRERRQYQFAGEYLIIGGKLVTEDLRAQVVAIFPDAYKPGKKIVEEPDPFTGAGIAGDEPVPPEGELKRLRELQKSGDYRGVLGLRSDILEPLFAARGYVSVLRNDNEQFKVEYTKELVEKQHKDLFYMVWRISRKKGGEVVVTVDEWADEVSWRRYDHYPLGTKLVKRKGYLEEETIMPDKPTSGEKE